MSTEKLNRIDLFKDQKETLFNSFKAIYEKIISNFEYLSSLPPSQINSYIESIANSILITEREQFIFYITQIISEFANKTNMKVPKFTSQFQEDMKNFNKKYDNDGQLSKILFKYFSKEYVSSNNLENGNNFIYNDQKLKEIPKIQSFYPHFLGFSYEAQLMRAMLFDLRTIIITSQNAFSLFLKKVKQKLNEFYQIQKNENNNKQNNEENEVVLKEREKANVLKKNIQILRDENDKFKLKVRGEIITIINLINSLNSNKESNSYQITFDEINKQSKKLIKMLKNDSILNEDFLKNDHLSIYNLSNESHGNNNDMEKLKLIKQIKEQNGTILNLRSQLADLKVELFKVSLNKSNSVMKSEENSQKEIKHIEYFIPQSLSSKIPNSNVLDNDSDITISELSNKGEMFNENYESNSAKTHKSINESSLITNDNASIISYNQNQENFNYPRNLNNHKFEIEELKRQLRNSKSLIDQLTDQNKKKDKAIARLSQKLQDSSSKFDVLFDKIHLLRKKNKILKKSKYSNNDNNVSIDDSSSSTSVYDCTRENLLVEQISDRTNELIFKDTIIIELENENRKLQAQIELMKENNTISSRQVLRLKDDIQHIQDSSLNDLDELSRQLNEKQILIREQADKISEFQQIKDKSEKYQKLKIVNKELTSKYQSLLSDVNKNRIEVQKVFEINKMKNENLKNKYSNLKEKYEKKKQVNISLVEQNKKLMGEIESLQRLANGKISAYQSEASSSNSQSLTDSFKNENS